MAVQRCKSPFSVRIGGVPRVVAAGELVQDSDPAYKGREHLFEPVGTYVDRIAEKRVDRVTSVEAATAEPGELREVSKPRRGRKPGPKPKSSVEPEAAGDEETVEES